MKNLFKRSRLLMGTTITAAILASGCGDSENFVFTNGVNIVPPPALNAPIANNDAFNALGNATLNRTAGNGVLTNDTLNGGEIIGFEAVGSNGGALVLNNDGSLSYTPVFGFVGAESFNYTIANASGESTATVTFTSTGSGYFVNNTVPDGGDGSQADPFDTLAEAIAAAGNGDTVFVNRGDGTNTGLSGQVNLPEGVDLIGEGAGLFVAQTIVPAGQAPVLQGPIVPMGDNTISGLSIQGSATFGIEVENAGDVTISQNTLAGHADNHINLLNTTGTITISDNVFEDPSNSNDDFINSDNTDTNGDLVIVDNVFLNDNGGNVEDVADVEPRGTSVMNITFSRNTADGQNEDDFDYGFYVECYDTSQATVTVDGNVMNNFDEEVIGLHARNGDSTINGSVTGNTISHVTGDDAIHVVLNGGTMTISGNNVSDLDDNCIDLEVEEDGGTFIVENNVLSAADNGIVLDDGEAGETKIAIRNNNISMSVLDSISLVWNGAGDFCADITGNTVDMDINLDSTGATGDFDVEQFNTLSAINNGATIDDTGTINNVADGECMIP